MYDQELPALQEAIQVYLDGLHEGDADKLASVFLPTSALTAEDNGTTKVMPRAEWLEAVKNRPSPKASGLSRHDHVLSIDMSGPTTAFVKVKCAIPPRFFTDYLAFLKIDGKWQVAQKIYVTDIRG